MQTGSGRDVLVIVWMNSPTCQKAFPLFRNVSDDILQGHVSVLYKFMIVQWFVEPKGSKEEIMGRDTNGCTHMC